MPASRRPPARASQNRVSRAAVNIGGDASRVTSANRAIPRCCCDEVVVVVVVAMPIRGR